MSMVQQTSDAFSQALSDVESLEKESERPRKARSLTNRSSPEGCQDWQRFLSARDACGLTVMSASKAPLVNG